jgi:2-iminobutanoate/2-iminopropanoate deaminase
MLNGLLFTSDQLPLDPATGRLVEGSIAERTQRCLDNLTAIAAVAGTSLDKAVKLTVFLTDIGAFKQVNEVYAAAFRQPFPARTAIQVAALPLGADIEIEAVLAL